MASILLLNNRMTKIKCDICNKEFCIDKFRSHVNKKHSSSFANTKKLAYYVIEKVYGYSEIELNNIISEYENNSVLFINKKYNFDFRRYLNDLGLKHKTIAEATSTENCIKNRENTCLKKYGVINPSKAEVIKNKKKSTFIKNYGVDNIRKLPAYRKEWEAKMIKKYDSVCLSNLHGNQNSFGWKTISEDDKNARIGNLVKKAHIWYYNLSEEDRANYNKKKYVNRGNYYVSSLEKRISQILTLNNILYRAQFFISKYPFDFVIGNHVIEVQGTYWHCDPRIYKATDLIKRNNKLVLVQEIWNKDLLKKKIVEEKGYDISYIWEFDMNNMDDDEILKKIRDINENKIN